MQRVAWSMTAKVLIDLHRGLASCCTNLHVLQKERVTSHSSPVFQHQSARCLAGLDMAVVYCLAEQQQRCPAPYGPCQHPMGEALNALNALFTTREHLSAFVPMLHPRLATLSCYLRKPVPWSMQEAVVSPHGMHYS